MVTMAFASSNGSNRGNGSQGGGNQRKGSGNRNKANQPPSRPSSIPPARPASSNGVSTPAPTNGSAPTPVTAAPRPQSQIQRASSSRQRIASGAVDQSRMRPLTRWFSNPAFIWAYVVLAVVAFIFIFTVNFGLVYPICCTSKDRARLATGLATECAILPAGD